MREKMEERNYFEKNLLSKKKQHASKVLLQKIRERKSKSDYAECAEKIKDIRIARN